LPRAHPSILSLVSIRPLVHCVGPIDRSNAQSLTPCNDEEHTVLYFLGRFTCMLSHTPLPLPVRGSSKPERITRRSFFVVQASWLCPFFYDSDFIWDYLGSEFHTGTGYSRVEPQPRELLSSCGEGIRIVKGRKAERTD